ncbi:MAG: hypothetical protein JSW67_08680 [Candidatus Latescibacterota bacterium]|nr:MAG: hypothetical protein JSW67_08680 [Candidatus Latescibacterota bacterium]
MRRPTGALSICTSLALLLALASAAEAMQAVADSVEKGDLLEKLQREDSEFFDPDLLEFDTTFRDSVIAALDSLGLETFKKQAGQRQFRLGLSYDLATRLWNYNRVEGLVLASGLNWKPWGEDHLWLQLQGAYATGSKKFRHHEMLRFPVGRDRWHLHARFHYQDRVQAYGSNRPTLNSVRAFVGGEDAQVYLRRQGGAGIVGWEPIRFFELTAGYAAGKETSVEATTGFSIFGHLDEFNPAIEEGTDRAVVAGIRLGSLHRHRFRLDIDHRTAGGGLGGDFKYDWTQATFTGRRYVGRQEFVLDLLWVSIGGEAPVQRLADVGGLSTVRGYKPRTQVGNQSFASRLEYLVPYNFFKATRVPLLRHSELQVVPWWDIGRTWQGNGTAWIQSAGAGLQRFLGPFRAASYLRFDFIFPIGPDRPSNFRFEIHFTRGLF